ncbi:hypothetical protein [Methanococcoides sp. AM1]|uniref:hypothetical protein n=1 Tax=Methanococcoides sp. AM1 TaxID=1201011 RepID=UPI001082754F|nr:hypothetical protein [Methanococcoides sp. AM1]
MSGSKNSMTRHSFDRYALIYYTILTLAIFLPLFRPGYILTLDTTWAAGRNYLADHILGNGIGGQAPFLAILQIMELVLPSWATQKIILFSVFLIAGISAHISAPSKSAYGKYFSGTLYAVNPFIYTRFLAGHLYLLLAYAFVPLAIRSFSDFLDDRTKWKRPLLWNTVVSIFDMHVLLIVLLIQLCIFIFVIVDERNERKNIIKSTIHLGLAYLAVNMFWILPVFWSVSQGSSILNQISAYDLSAFTASSTISGNILLSLAMMYGFWRGGYEYPFHFASKWIFMLLFTGILYFAIHGFLPNTKKPLHKGLVLSAIISLLLAGGITYQYSAPIFEYLFDHFFIFKGMRDSQKFVGALVLAYAFLGSLGVDEIFKSFKLNDRMNLVPENKQKILSVALAVLIIAVPLAYSFTIFNGFNGQIEPKDYPAEWYEVNDFLNNDSEDFDVLFFPWHLYMTFNWSDRRIANPANLFFDKPTMIGENAEVGHIRTQSSKPTQHYMGYLLEHKNETDNFGELVAPLNVKYIVLAKDVDYQKYDFLYDQSDLELVMENEELIVFRNLHKTSRIREVNSLIEIKDWAELVELSKTIDINDHGYLMRSANQENIEMDLTNASAKELNYTAVSPFRYHLYNSTEYVLFTSPEHDQNGWVLDNGESLDSAGLTSIFTASKDTAGDSYIRYKPFTAHIIGALISLLITIIILLWSYRKNTIKL